MKISKRILVLSIAIPGFFVTSMLLFFVLNTKAYDQMPLLNLFQFNIENVSYRFIPGIFGYTLVGCYIILLWFYIWRVIPKAKFAALVFSLSGVLLLILGVIPTSQGQVATVFCASIIYVLLNIIGLIVLLSKATKVLNKLVLSSLLVFAAYELVDRFILFNHDFDINALIITCFVWYLYLFKYLISEFSINTGRQITLS
jgi:hypothetical protein